MKYFLYLFSLIILSASNSLANNNDFNSDSSIEIVVTPAYNPNTFGELIEGTWNHVFQEASLLSAEGKALDFGSGSLRYSAALWKSTSVSDGEKTKILRVLKKAVTNYFYDDAKSINTSVILIRSSSDYYSETIRTDDLKENPCLSLLMTFDESSAQMSLTNKGRNLAIRNLKLTAGNCNGVIKTLSIPTIYLSRSKFRDYFYYSNYKAALYTVMDKLIKPMNLDPKHYYSKYTPKRERRFVKINGKELNNDKIIAEEEIKNYLKNRSSSLEGIYHKESSSSKSPRYKVAVLKITNSLAPWNDKDDSKQKYVAVYLSGATNASAFWTIGDVKFYFRPTIKDNYYETWYYMANKSVSNNTAITFGYMTEKDSKGSYTYWRTDLPSSKYFQGANISINREDNSSWYSDDYWERLYPYKSKPSSSSLSTKKSKSKSSTPKGKKTGPQKGIKID
ncbi:MAG: hypothetical protein ABGW56_03130 [Flavobacteriaceae bacterium]